MDLFIDILIQLLFSIGAVILCGMLIARCNRTFYSMLGTKSRTVCVATGLIGTPIHEIGHAFFCVLFGHKIKKISLYHPDPDSGVLGYVQHTHNPKNIYQKIGNFFIGVGPILFGSAFLVLLLWLMIPHVFYEFMIIPDMYLLETAAVDKLYGLGNGFVEMFFIFLNAGNLAEILWWVYLVVGCFIALHMTLSKEDIKGSASGIVLTVLVIVSVSVVLFFASPRAYLNYQHYFGIFSTYLLSVLLISVFFAVIILILALILRGIKILIKKK